MNDNPKKNVIEGIFKKNPNNWAVIIKTRKGTLEQMEISAPFHIEVSRLLNNDDVPCKNIGITFSVGEDPSKIKTSIHPMTKENGIDISKENSFNLLVVDINNE